MALKRNERYPGRFSNPTTAQPQGAFKNRSAPGAQDGSYLEQDWANDWSGFFGRLLTLAGITPNGNVDTALSSQYYDALQTLTGSKGYQVFSTVGTTNWTVPDIVKLGRKVKVTVIGSGGSGGRSSAGGGGGAGGIATKLVDLTGVSSVSVTVGAGAPRPARGTTVIDGNGGNSSSFGSYLSATGGYGGGSVSGGRAGLGVGGDFNSSLGPGNAGASSGSSYVGGSGGGPGGAGALSSTTPDGSDALGPGGGGSGAAFGATAQTCGSGSGKDGIVIVEW